MSQVKYYRGGTNLTPKPGEVKIDRATGQVMPGWGISVFDRPDGLERFGGANEVTNLPEGLQIIQRGKNPHHHEITPSRAMPPDEYVRLLQLLVLVPV